MLVNFSTRKDKEDEPTAMYQQQKEPMSQKAKRYWALGIVIVVLVAALLIGLRRIGACH